MAKEINQEMKYRGGGISAHTLMISVIIVLAILQIGIIFLIYSSNANSRNLSATMRTSGERVSEATSLLAGSSVLSETATNYVLLPVLEDGKVNAGPLIAYAQELGIDRRGGTILEHFKNYDVDAKVYECVRAAAEAAGLMMQDQLHAIALVSSVYPLPPVPELSAIPVPELTEEEMNWPEEQRVSQGRHLLIDQKYAQQKHIVSQSIGEAAQLLNEESTAFAIRTTATIEQLRVLLWIVTITIIVLLAVIFMLFYRQMIYPLNRFAHLLVLDSSLDEKHGLKEIRLVASAYNGVKQRRDALDGILRSAAETDALTGLPNRYSFERYLLTMEEKEEGGPLAVLMFDVNYLKETNDTQGHFAGDQLLKLSAECIESCFRTEEECNCFRIGGDEFAAVLQNPTKELIEEKIRLFKEKQKKAKVSIAWGYAMGKKNDSKTVHVLIDEADQKMYEMKQQMHKTEPFAAPG